ncbi:MAG: hypothetical protein EAZ53_15565 [Bacteroidetes bacterium]|nr:MAG: hypothetical protein EAZ53_15565 [Bacteroidota bacterium]
MNLLPFVENAEIPEDKLLGYCLNMNHERGKHKANVFYLTFGITEKEANLLKNAILSSLTKFEVTQIRENNFGKIYTIPLELTIFDKTAEVLTAWIIEHNSKKPRLITCYVNI